MLDKKRRILFFVSLIGIVVVSLMLVTTYAYQTIVVDYADGSSNKVNKNDVRTAKLDVCLEDRTDKEECNNGEEVININISDMPLLPDYKTADYTEFTITNNSTNVISYSIGLTDLTYNSVLKTSDFKYTITKVNESNETVIGSGDFSSLTGDSFELKFYIGNYMDILVDGSNKLRLYLWLQETNEDQSSLESSASTTVSFKGKLEITSVFSIDIAFNESTLLAENIINNAKLAKKNNSDSLTKFMKPVSKIAADVSEETERVLFLTEDDYGSSYYFRGNVEDNYVNFAEMCWRVVRIQGDGSIKLILEDKNTTCNDTEDADGTGTADYAYTGNWVLKYGNYGYEEKEIESYDTQLLNYLEPEANATSSMVKAFYDFQTTGKLKDYTDKLKSGDWCLADKAYSRSASAPYTYTLLDSYDYLSNIYYDAYVRLSGTSVNGYNPSLKCTGTLMSKFKNVVRNGIEITKDSNMYVGALTLDEIVYAGGKVDGGSANYYLINNNNSFLSFSAGSFSYPYTDVFFVQNDGNLDYYIISESFGIRPSVLLEPSSIFTINSDIENYGAPGTKTNPYIVN